MNFRREHGRQYQVGDHVHIESKTQMMCLVVTKVNEEGFAARAYSDKNADCPVFLGWKKERNLDSAI